jgi:hypothetical protein
MSKLNLTDHHLRILRILSGQSPGYDAFPNATCFVVEGYHDFQQVNQLLDELADAGLAQRYVYDVIVKAPHEVLAELPKSKRLLHAVRGTQPDPETEQVPGGYEITDDGRAALAQLDGQEPADA